MMDKFQDQKDKLEIEKLELEVKKLNKRIWFKPEFYALLLPFILLITGYLLNKDYIDQSLDHKRWKLERENEQLEKRKSQLAVDTLKLNNERLSIRTQINKVLNERDSALGLIDKTNADLARIEANIEKSNIEKRKLEKEVDKANQKLDVERLVVLADNAVDLIRDCHCSFLPELTNTVIAESKYNSTLKSEFVHFLDLKSDSCEGNHLGTLKATKYFTTDDSQDFLQVKIHIESQIERLYSYYDSARIVQSSLIPNVITLSNWDDGDRIELIEIVNSKMNKSDYSYNNSINLVLSDCISFCQGQNDFYLQDHSPIIMLDNLQRTMKFLEDDSYNTFVQNDTCGFIVRAMQNLSSYSPQFYCSWVLKHDTQLRKKFNNIQLNCFNYGFEFSNDQASYFYGDYYINLLEELGYHVGVTATYPHNYTKTLKSIYKKRKNELSKWLDYEHSFNYFRSNPDSLLSFINERRF